MLPTAPQKRITIADELVNQMARWPTLMRKAEDFRHKMKKIATSKPYDAIDLICRYWYYAYAKENELDIGKVDNLYALAVREETIKGFLERLEQLPKLIESYKCTEENPVILSTIHSAKGLEFDTVYIVDAYDGCLPHSCREDAPEQERIDSYEEERLLFYMGITRAKNELNLFYVSECGSEFINEIIPLVNPSNEEIAGLHLNVCEVEPQSPTVSGSTDVLLSAYTLTARVLHSNYGKGIIIGVEKKREDIHVIEVQFDNGSKSKLHLEVVVQMGLLKLL